MVNNYISKKFCPFFLNTNLILNKNELKDIDYFFATIARNIGNSYIGYSIIKIIYGYYKKVDQIQSIWNYDFSQIDKDISFINENYTHLIFCFQNQLNSDKHFSNLPWKEITKFIKKIKLPIIPVSLGCNCLVEDYQNLHKTLNKDLVNFFQILSSKSELLGVRGEKTLELLLKLGIKNAVAVGCPSFYEDLTPNKKIVKKEFNNNFKLLLNNHNIIIDYKGCNCYVLQDEKQIVELLYFKNTKIRQNFNKQEQYLIYNALVNKNVLFFPSVEKWKQKILEEKYDLYIGSRVHGAIMSLNAQVPAIVFQNDVRAFEMCNLLKIPFFNITSFYKKKLNVEKLYNSVSYTEFNRNFNNNYLNFKNFLLKCGVEFNLSLKTDNVFIDEIFFENKLPEEILDDILININNIWNKNKMNILKEKILNFFDNNKKLSPILKKKKHKIFII